MNQVVGFLRAAVAKNATALGGGRVLGTRGRFADGGESQVTVPCDTAPGSNARAPTARQRDEITHVAAGTTVARASGMRITPSTDPTPGRAARARPGAPSTRPLLVILAIAMPSARAAADPDVAAPVVVKHERARELIVRAWIGFGARQLDGGNLMNESVGGIELGGELGYRFGSNVGVVTVLGVNSMPPSRYLTYVANTVGAGIHWDGPIVLTVGAGVAFANAERFTPDVMLVQESFTGATAFAHGTVPLYRIGSGRLGVNIDLAAMTLAGGPNILSGSAGVGVSW